MKKVIVNGTGYVCKMEEKGKKVYLREAMMATFPVSQGTFGDYLEAKELGELEELTITGQGMTISESPFSSTEKMNLNMCKLAMKEARRTAGKKLVNSTFRNLLGK